MNVFKHRQFNKGVALITALMVMSLATITAVQMTADQQVYMRRTENIRYHEQVFMYLLSAEDFTKIVLSEDDPKQDSFRDDWYSEEPIVFPIEGGVLTGKVSDLQGKFNINNLSKTQRNEWDEDRLRQALSNYNMPADFASIIIDWMDENQDSQPGGAEDVDYLNGDRAYRTAGTKMGSISELKLLKGMNQENYENLLEVLTVIPNEDNATININSASAPVLRMIIPELSESEADDLAKDLVENPLNEPDDLISHALVKGKKVDINGLSTETNYFLLESFASVQHAKSRMDSIIYRQSKDDIKVVMRSQGGL
ncbi:hypothetical protein MNBD_GAMMA21-1447 [hydrothermal vent metagenome]|uniref:T2SS protein K first SAM-like domain-containing protein n=1 Tax=hydrothermal vent metagenome TaxID=652676 RepID=A0A3B0ZUA6_9ZZZZ